MNSINNYIHLINRHSVGVSDNDFDDLYKVSKTILEQFTPTHLQSSAMKNCFILIHQKDRVDNSHLKKHTRHNCVTFRLKLKTYEINLFYTKSP